MTRVLQLTDLHLLEAPQQRLLGVRTEQTLAAVLDAALTRHRPAAVVLSGDIAHDPTPAVYRRCRQLLEARLPGVPLLAVPGNHDAWAAFDEVFAGLDRVRLGAWGLLGFDSHRDDHPEAVFDAAALRALQQRCAAEPAEHLLLVTHHPPVDVGSTWLDKDRLGSGGGPPEVLDWAAVESRVNALLFGHVHQPVDSRYHGLRLLGCPSTCFQFTPGSTRFSVDDALPGYRWLELQADGRFDTGVERLQAWPAGAREAH